MRMWACRPAAPRQPLPSKDKHSLRFPRRSRPPAQVMAAKHGCSAREVQDVLYALEREEQVMFDEHDQIYLCA